MLKRMICLAVLLVNVLWLPTSEASVVVQKEIDEVRLQEVLLKLPWAISDREEKAPERSDRALRMSRALIAGAREVNAPMGDKLLIGAAASIWWNETRFSHEVHRGELSRWGSDDGRAKCFGQLHESRVGIKIAEGETLSEFRERQRTTWKALAGTDFEATKRCAISTMKAFRSSLGTCRSAENPWVSAFGEYGLGDGQCRELPQSARRLRLARKIAALL